MSYQTLTLGQYITQISDLMDDPGQLYWTQSEIKDAVYEALRVWGAYTNYWRERGAFAVTPSRATPYYDMSVELPALRPRTAVLEDLVKQIQTMLLEADAGITGTGMTGQVSVSSILQAINVSRNRFVLDTHLPISVHPITDPPSPSGMVEFPQSSVFVHRASWKDSYGGAWATLMRQDAWAADKASPLWTLDPGNPLSYSEAENSPLRLQLEPIPANNGELEILSVDSVDMDLTNAAAPLLLPDEWVHAVKYAALSYILYGEGQIKDVVRAEYAENRYKQAVDMAADARSVMRLICNGVPMNVDSMFNIDFGFPYWRNTPGRPQMAGVLYDMVVTAPGLPQMMYSITADVVRSAPVPLTSNDYMPVGQENMDAITDYVTHILVFKCGGEDLKSTFSGYDSFMSAVSKQHGVNRAKIQNFTALMGQPQKEWQQRPDRIITNA